MSHLSSLSACDLVQLRRPIDRCDLHRNVSGQRTAYNYSPRQSDNRQTCESQPSPDVLGDREYKELRSLRRHPREILLLAAPQPYDVSNKDNV